MTVSLTITNTGLSIGSDVIQIYVADRKGPLRRPLKELKGFQKVKDLQSSSSTDVGIILNKYAFSYWDDNSDIWVAAAGDYDVIVARSSRARDVIATLKVTLAETLKWKGL